MTARLALAVLLLALAAPLRAGIIFNPHLANYARPAPGQYFSASLFLTEIEEIYDGDGNVIQNGTPFTTAGGSTDAALSLIGSLWVGNVFRDTDIWILKTRPQICGLIGTLWYQENTEQIGDRTRVFGAKAGANGPGDLFGICGIYGDEHQWGPVQWNGLLATIVKAPVGRYDTDAVLNSGTNYWSYIPALAFHSKIFDRLWIDGVFGYQFNENNDSPAFLGLTPTDIANWRNYEVNVAWKFTEHWFVDAGYGYRESVGPNRFEKVNISNEEPVNAEDRCIGLGLPRDSPLCNSTNRFFVQSQPGVYSDKGIEGEMVTFGFNYIYRTSSVIQLRWLQPIAGRGSEIIVPLTVYNAIPDNNGGYTRGNTPIATNQPSKQYPVQEAAAVSASPLLELRFVYLFWAP